MKLYLKLKLQRLIDTYMLTSVFLGFGLFQITYRIFNYKNSDDLYVLGVMCLLFIVLISMHIKTRKDIYSSLESDTI
jgi:hypothetical protein